MPDYKSKQFFGFTLGLMGIIVSDLMLYSGLGSLYLFGLIIGFILGVVGLILSIVSLRQARDYGARIGLSVAGIILSCVGIFSAIMVYGVIAALTAVAANI